MNKISSLPIISERISVNLLNWLKSLLLLAGFIFGGQVLAAQAITFYHNDILGSPVAVTNINGDLCWREDYKPYGEKILNNDEQQPGNPLCGLDDNQRGYTNHVHDKDIGLTYMQARYYDPAIGRFMGIDPVGVKLENHTSINRYVYGNNNPFRFIDPNGMEADDGPGGDFGDLLGGFGDLNDDNSLADDFAREQKNDPPLDNQEVYTAKSIDQLGKKMKSLIDEARELIDQPNEDELGESESYSSDHNTDDSELSGQLPSRGKVRSPRQRQRTKESKKH